MFLTKEATYIFKTRYATKQAHVSIDAEEGRRYLLREDGRYKLPDSSFPDDQSMNNTEPDLSNSNPLNYKGTGAEFRMIEAELVNETIFFESEYSVSFSSLYKLPDVNQYARVDFYSPLPVQENDPANTIFNVTFLSKLVP